MEESHPCPQRLPKVIAALMARVSSVTPVEKKLDDCDSLGGWEELTITSGTEVLNITKYLVSRLPISNNALSSDGSEPVRAIGSDRIFCGLGNRSRCGSTNYRRSEELYDAQKDDDNERSHSGVVPIALLELVYWMR